MFFKTATHPEFSVDPLLVKVGDKLIVGGPGATYELNELVNATNLTEGNEVTITSLNYSRGLAVVTGGGNTAWDLRRFSLPGIPVRSLQVGDTVRVLRGSWCLKAGDTHVVSAAGRITDKAAWCVCVDGSTNLTTHGWFANRFELVEQPEPTKTKIVIVGDEVDVFQVPRRAYDFAKGDRRFTDRNQAIDHGIAEFDRTGVQQLVRRDSAPEFIDLFVVQTFGS